MELNAVAPNTRSMPAPTDRTMMVRRPEMSIRYTLLRRLHDRISGNTDGRRNTATVRTGADVSTMTSMWLARSAATLAERLEHEQLVHQAIVADASTRTSTVTTLIAEVTTQLQSARERANALPGEPDNLNNRGPAEANAPTAVIHARRRREYTTTVTGPARRKVAELEGLLEQLRAERSALDAVIATAERVTATRAERLTQFHLRRDHTYRRAYLRAALKNRERATDQSPVRTIRQEQHP